MTAASPTTTHRRTADLADLTQQLLDDGAVDVQFRKTAEWGEYWAGFWLHGIEADGYGPTPFEALTTAISIYDAQAAEARP